MRRWRHTLPFAALLPAVADGAAADPFAAFEAWAARHVGAAKAASVDEGVALAERRRAALAALLRADPAAAIARAVPPATRARLPAEIQARLERPVSALGVLTDIARSEWLPDGRTTHAPSTRVAVIGAEIFVAYGAGRRARLRSLEPLPLHGIALGHELAIAEDPVRVLDGDEPAARAAAAQADCGAGAAPLATHVGSGVVTVCDRAALDALRAELWRAERKAAMAGALRAKASAATLARTTGSKTIVWLRVRFSDQAESVVPPEATIHATAAGVAAFMRDFSYGRFAGLEATVPPVLVLPDTEAAYRHAPGGDMRLLADARAAALAAGIDVTRFDFYVVRYHGGPGASAGQALVGVPGMWLRTDSAGIAAHELGHNLGLYHANAWTPAGADPAGAGTHEEYGNPFDRLGGGSTRSEHFCASFKHALGWLDGANVARLWGSGRYRIAPQDSATLGRDRAHAARHGRARLWIGSTAGGSPQSGQYWFEQRLLRSEFAAALHVNLDGDDNWLIDTTPGSRDGTSDAGLVLGRTYSDPQLGLHVTPLAIEREPEPVAWLKLERGRFDGNRSPEVALTVDLAAVAERQPVRLVASAVDPDGDELNYSWDWGDGSSGGGSAHATRSWASAGNYRVRVVASDGRGGVASAAATVRVGAPTGLRVAGRVLAGGVGVEGVHVWNGLGGGHYRGAHTDSDGHYAIENLEPGPLALRAARRGYRVASAAPLPAVLAGSLTGVDFVALPEPEVEVEALDARADPMVAGDRARLRLARRGPLDAPLTVYFRLDGSATLGIDYTLAGAGSTRATFPAGAATLELAIVPVADTVPDEPDERVVLRLADGVDYEAIYPAAAEVVIAGRPAPVNDDFAHRITVSGSRIDLTGSNRDATLEFAEPPPGPDGTGTATLWWRWVAPADGTVVVDLGGSAIDTVLDVHRGETLEALQLVASNDDADGARTSRVAFAAEAGARYAIAVGSAGAFAAQGELRLRLDFTPAGSASSPFTLFGDGFD